MIPFYFIRRPHKFPFDKFRHFLHHLIHVLSHIRRHILNILRAGDLSTTPDTRDFLAYIFPSHALTHRERGKTSRVVRRNLRQLGIVLVADTCLLVIRKSEHAARREFSAGNSRVFLFFDRRVCRKCASFVSLHGIRCVGFAFEFGGVCFASVCGCWPCCCCCCCCWGGLCGNRVFRAFWILIVFIFVLCSMFEKFYVLFECWKIDFVINTKFSIGYRQCKAIYGVFSIWV